MTNFQKQMKQAMDAFLKNPDALLREYLSQQITHHRSEIKWHEGKITSLKQEIRELSKTKKGTPHGR